MVIFRVKKDDKAEKLAEYLVRVPGVLRSTLNMSTFRTPKW